MKIRGNQGNFVNKSLSMSFSKRSHLKTKYLKNRTVENRALYKKQRNHCTYLKRDAINTQFSKATEHFSEHNSKPIFNLLKPYMTNKGALSSDDIILQESGVFINEDTKLADIFNDYYVNIVKHTTGQPPSDITNDLDAGVSVDQIVNKIVSKFLTHPGINE